MRACSIRGESTVAARSRGMSCRAVPHAYKQGCRKAVSLAVCPLPTRVWSPTPTVPGAVPAT